MNNTIKEILEEFDEKFPCIRLIDCPQHEKGSHFDSTYEFGELKSFLLSSIKKVVEGCPETVYLKITRHGQVMESEAPSPDHTAWKSAILKEIEKEIE